MHRPDLWFLLVNVRGRRLLLVHDHHVLQRVDLRGLVHQGVVELSLVLKRLGVLENVMVLKGEFVELVLWVLLENRFALKAQDCGLPKPIILHRHNNQMSNTLII